MRAVAGWWPTKSAAEAALSEAISEAFAEEIAEALRIEARRAAGRVLRDQFADRIRALELRCKALGGRNDLFLREDGFSLGQGLIPYTEEALVGVEAEIVEREAKARRNDEFRAAAPELLAQLELLGVEVRLTIFGLELVENGRWETRFDPSTEGDLEAFRTFVEEQGEISPAANISSMADLMAKFNSR